LGGVGGLLIIPKGYEFVNIIIGNCSINV
jgi:hypothetical protein